MPRPALALLLAGKLGRPEDGLEKEEDNKDEAKLDAARHLIAAIRGVKSEDVHDRDASDVLECIHNLLELCRDDEEEEEEEPEEEDSEGKDDSEY